MHPCVQLINFKYPFKSFKYFAFTLNKDLSGFRTESFFFQKETLSADIGLLNWNIGTGTDFTCLIGRFHSMLSQIFLVLKILLGIPHLLKGGKVKKG